MNTTEKKIPMALCYDFDGTLVPQEFAFIKELGMTDEEFWAKTDRLAQKQGADPILAYMKSMIDSFREKGLSVRKEKLHQYGENYKLFNGLDTWFDDMTEYAAAKNIDLKHYVISSGLKEIIEGTKIAPKLSGIFASYFMYDKDGNAEWPAVALNYTTKTQYLYRLNKNALDITDNMTINRYIPPSERFLPFTNMIYIGDGETDIPCMKMIRVRGGHSIAVYDPKDVEAGRKIAALVKDKRVHFTSAADYSKNGAMAEYVRRVIDKISADNRLSSMESIK
jgi:2-hydroxy-3-keto-5-methylthiopentenyl-1-phosphate phosphatase